MRVDLKGIHRVEMKLATGETRVYHYAWRGGPRITAQPGTPDFVRQYQEAHAALRAPTAGTFMTLIAAFKGSAEYLQLAPSTVRAYTAYLKLIEDEFGDMPLAALKDPRVRGEFKAWRDRFANTPRKADYAWSTLSRILSFSKDRGLIGTNPCEGGGRLYTADRTDKIWQDADVASFLKVAAPELALAMMLALWTGQRQGDLLRLPWSAYDGKHIRLTQSKTGRRIVVPAGAPLRTLLERTERCGPSCSAARAARSDDHPRATVDVRWIPNVVGQGVRASRHRRPDVPRYSRVGGGAARPCRRDGAADRNVHRPQLEGRRTHPRRALPRARREARRDRGHETRNENKSVNGAVNRARFVQSHFG